MKNIVLGFAALSLASTLSFAEELPKPIKSSGVFFGVDYFQGESEYKVDVSGLFSGDEEFDQTGVRVKFGVHDKNNIRFQGYLKIEDFDDAFDDKIYGFGADAIFTFPVQPTFSPYLLVGFSSDWTELDDPGIEYSEDSLNAFALKGGVGALFRLNQKIELQAGFDIQYRSWQEIEVDDPIFGRVDIEQEDVSKTLYLGLNFFF